MKVKIKSWNAVAEWYWDISNNKDASGEADNCSICMNAFESPCPNCKTPGDDCPPVEGNCSHFFHLHCIYKWLETNQKCPLDRTLWTEKINSVMNKNHQPNIPQINNQSSGNQNSSRMDIEN